MEWLLRFCGGEANGTGFNALFDLLLNSIQARFAGLHVDEDEGVYTRFARKS
jgi:hypothetical protein